MTNATTNAKRWTVKGIIAEATRRGMHVQVDGSRTLVARTPHPTSFGVMFFEDGTVLRADIDLSIALRLRVGDAARLLF
jgi:hypothetical protein